MPGREKQIFEKVAKLNAGPLADDAIKAIYREVMSASISLQKDVRIAYLGPPGTYSHQVSTSLVVVVFFVFVCLCLNRCLINSSLYFLLMRLLRLALETVWNTCPQKPFLL